MPVSVCLGLPTGPARGELARLGTPSAEPRRSAGCSRGEGSDGQSRQTQVAGPTWLPWKGLFKKQLLLAIACSGTSDKAATPFGLRLQGEAARRREVSLSLATGKACGRGSCHPHTPLTCPGRFPPAGRSRNQHRNCCQAAEVRGQPTASAVLSHFRTTEFPVTGEPRVSPSGLTPRPATSPPGTSSAPPGPAQDPLGSPQDGTGQTSAVFPSLPL